MSMCAGGDREDCDGEDGYRDMYPSGICLRCGMPDTMCECDDIDFNEWGE